MLANAQCEALKQSGTEIHAHVCLPGPSSFEHCTWRHWDVCCMCAWLSFLSSEHLKAFSSVPPLLPRTESWALTSYQQRPLPSLHPSTSPPPRPPPPFFPYRRAWKGSTARSRSSGGSLLNCLLSVGSGTVRWGEMGGGGFKKPWKSSHTCLPDSKNKKK